MTKIKAFYEASIALLDPNSPSEWDSLERAYSGRAYHNLHHLAEMIDHLAEFHPPLHPAPTECGIPLRSTFAPIFGMALLYHDVVYKAHRKDNEARSAELASAALVKRNVDQKRIDYCHQLIMATKTHVAKTDDEGWLNDFDLGVLARPAAGYDEYAAAVRKEFAIYPNLLYRPGRRKALQSLLDQERIYYHAATYNRWEAKARDNLKRELKRY